ncbi:MAG: HD domain-containing protein [Syntrophobacteraceae bacterium]
MKVPSRSECFSLMEEVQMPCHIRVHSAVVAEIALFLGRRLNGYAGRLDLELLEAGALLHDIGKPRSLATGERHHDLGADMLEARGYSLLSPIVRDHIAMDWDRATGPITESLLVNYADKRVKHDEIVTLEDRFEDLIARYTKTQEQAEFMRGRLNLYRTLEERIFGYLPIGPTAAELMWLELSDDPCFSGGNGDA